EGCRAGRGTALSNSSIRASSATPRHHSTCRGEVAASSRAARRYHARVDSTIRPSCGNSVSSRDVAVQRSPDAAPTMDEEGNAMGYKVTKTDEQWREELGDDRFRVLRQAGTERAWTGELLNEHRAGLYTCAACGAELFKSGTKFDSGCGWPSFYDSVNPDAVQ